MTIKQFIQLAREAISSWSDDYAPSMGAAIAYYTIFSLAPLLLIVIAVAGFVFGRDAVQGQIEGQLAGMMGREGAVVVQDLIKSASKPAEGIVATVISLVMLAIGATTVIGELQSALDRIWRVPAAAAGGVLATVKTRLLSFALILGMAFLLMVSLVVSTAVAAMGHWASAMLPGWQTALIGINTLVSLAIMSALFAMIYKFMPKAHIAWRDVWVGAAATAVLFELGKTLIGLYVGKSGVSSSYAAAGSLVVLLVWVYYSAQIFLLGAEFTWVYSNHFGSRRDAAREADTTAVGDAVPSRAGNAAAAPTPAPVVQLLPTAQEYARDFASRSHAAAYGRQSRRLPPTPAAKRLADEVRRTRNRSRVAAPLTERLAVAAGLALAQAVVRMAMHRGEKHRAARRR